MARQYQRYIIELFLWCFEDAIKHGNRSIDGVVQYWENRSKKAGESLSGDLGSIAKSCAGDLYDKDELVTSRAWNKKVTSIHARFEYIEEPCDDAAVIACLRMLSGWYWRMLFRQQDDKNKPFYDLGGADRMSMNWFLQWLNKRKSLSVHHLLKDIFSSLIFSQHIRIALARFDGSAQRLRFLIGDAGIEPTVSARQDMAKRKLPWMSDRLAMLAGLLCDCDVLTEREGILHLGRDANDLE